MSNNRASKSKAVILLLYSAHETLSTVCSSDFSNTRKKSDMSPVKVHWDILWARHDDVQGEFKKILYLLIPKKNKAAYTYLLGECRTSADRFFCIAHSEWKVHHWKYKCSVRKKYYCESGKGCMRRLWDVHFWRCTKFKKSLNNLLYLDLLYADELPTCVISWFCG